MAALTRREKDKIFFGLPRRITLYTLDQICEMMQVNEETLRENFLWFDGRTHGVQPKRMLKALNVSADHQTPVWRVDEDELMRWYKAIQFRTTERTW